MALLYYHGKIQSENMKLEAALHGAKIEGESEQKAKADEIIFKDPKEYEKLSPEERKRQTQQMLGKLQGLNLPGLKKLTKKGDK